MAYAKIAFANMRDYVDFDSDGMKANDLKDLTLEQAFAIAEISESKAQEDRRIFAGAGVRTPWRPPA